MKIAQIIYGIAGGGANKVALSIIKGLLDTDAEIHLIRINVPYNNNNEKEVANYLDEKGIKNYCLHRKHGSLGVASFVKLVKIIKAEKYDIIHSHLLIPDIYSALASFFLRKRYTHFITVHNRIVYHHKFLINTIFRKSVFIKCSPAIPNLLSKREEVVIPNSVEINKYNPNNNIAIDIREELKLKDDSLLILMVGNLRKQKNYATALMAFKSLLDTYKTNNIHLLICGDGEEFKALSEYVIEHKINEFIHFLGLRKDISKILKSSNLFLSTSLWEGMPIAVLEALSSGISVLLSPIDEHKVVCENIYDCHFSESMEPISFAEKSWSILNEMNKTSKQKIFEKRIINLTDYTSESFCNSHLKLYNKYLC